MRRQFRLAAFLVLTIPPLATAGEDYFLLMFGSQQIPNDPNYSHSFATFVRVSWPGDGPMPKNPTIEEHTISWLPENMRVRLATVFAEPVAVPTVTVAIVDDAEAPLASVATAFSWYVPAATLFQENENGAVVSVPSSVDPLKKSTFDRRFSGSDAFADKVIVAGAVNVAPLAGAVNDTVGG